MSWSILDTGQWEVCTFQVWAKSDFVSKLIEILITFQTLLESEFQKKFMSIYNSS